jgi:hypothetical protein
MTRHPSRLIVRAHILRDAAVSHYAGRPLAIGEPEWVRALYEDWADFDRPCEALASRDPGQVENKP